MIIVTQRLSAPPEERELLLCRLFKPNFTANHFKRRHAFN